MSLFEENKNNNLLPIDGNAIYYGKIINNPNHYYQKLLYEILWKNDEAIVMGKRLFTKRKVAWYGNKNYSYTYSKITKTALIWNELLLELKNIVEKITITSFNSCLLNLYNSGEEGMAWHSDSEKELGKNTTIASLSFGAERIFCFKHKLINNKVSIILENGGLLVMKDETQSNWLHSLPKSKKIKTPRINLTFRTIIIGNT